MKKRLALAVSLTMLGLALAVPVAFGASPSTLSRTLGLPSSLRGTKGGGGGSPIGYLPLHPRQYALAKATANAKAGVGSKRRSGGGGGGPIITTPTNVSPSFDGTYQTGLTPPDTTGAIGNDRYIEGINTKYAIYSRLGSLINSGSLSSLTGISGGLFGYSLSDPQIMFDVKTQRFFYTAVYYDSLFLSDNGLAIGWSKTPTPASSNDFCKYVASFGGDLPDYPKLGDSSDFLLYGYNNFTNAASTYTGSQFLTLNKPISSTAVGGSTCQPTSDFSLHSFGVNGLATPVPANLVDDGPNGTAGYVVANPDLSNTSSTSTIGVFSVRWDGHTLDSHGHPSPSVSGQTSVGGVSRYSMPPNAPQNGSSALLDTLDGRFEAAVAAVDPAAGGIAVWTAHAVKSSDSLRSEERWYEINPSGSLYHSGAATSTLFTWNGAISPDRSGSLPLTSGSGWAMSVNTSSSGTYPAIQLITKTTGLTPLVQATGPNVDFSCSPCRWGDYSGATPDPGATVTGKVWLANQYNVASSDSSGTDWRTRIFAATP